MKKGACIILILLTGLLLAVCGYSWYAGYEGCINLFMATRDAGQNAQQVYRFVSPQKFEEFRFLLLAYLLVATVMLLNFSAVYKFAAMQLSYLLQAAKAAFKTAFNTGFKYLLIIPVVATVYYAATMPINFDEALTWMWFTSKGLLSAVGYYPAPNNHILFSVISCLTRYIPFAGPLLCMRISSVVAAVCILVFYNAMLNKHFNKNTALVVVGVSSVLFMSLYYGYMARGYALAGLFFISAFYAALNIVNGETEVKNYVAFGLASVLGFYTMPSFLYAFVMLNAIVVLSRPAAFYKLLITDMAIGLAVLLLYMPVLIINGVDALINNPYVAPLERNQVVQMLPQFTPTAVLEITGIPAIYFVPMLLLSLVLLVKSRNRNYIILFMVLLAGPFVLVLAHSVIRYSRTFSYYTFLLVLLIAMPWRQQLQQVQTKYLLPLLLIVQMALLANFGSEIYLYEHYGQVSERVIQSIAGNKSYFCDEPMFEIPLQFKLRTGAYNYKFANTRNVPVSADTLLRYDYVIIRNTCDQTMTRQPCIRTEFYNVYRPGPFVY